MRSFRIVGPLAGLLAAGCQQDTRPIYAPPALSPAQTVTLKATGGYFVDGVDGARIEGMQVTFAGLGGNGTTLAPGRHRVRANLSAGNLHGTTKFTFTYVAGHTYTIDNQGLFDPTMKLTDDTTGQVVLNGHDDDD